VKLITPEKGAKLFLGSAAPLAALRGRCANDLRAVFGRFLRLPRGHSGAQTRLLQPFSILAANGQNALSTGAIWGRRLPQKIGRLP
jgi:hypothetical protein